MIAESPILRLPESSVVRSAPPVVVLEPDPLVRLLVEPAVEALGYRVAAAGTRARAVEPAAVFVPVEEVDDCRRVCARVRRSSAGRPSPLVVGYGAEPPALLAAHRAHRCADVVVRLVAVAGRPRLVHLPASDPVATAGLTLREADVLVLLLRGLTTSRIAAALCVSPHTARTHCRAVLRKLGAGDRRALRARFLAGPSDGSRLSRAAGITWQTVAPGAAPADAWRIRRAGGYGTPPRLDLGV